MPELQTLFLTALSQHSLTVLLLAFLGGVMSSLLPCTVGMLPVLVGYVGGYTATSKLAILRQILLFMVGFALVLTALGILASILGTAMAALVGVGWYYFLGVLAILMGLQLLEVIQIPLPQFVIRLPESKAGSKAGEWLAPIVLGAAFGAASSPCGTPFLTAILGFISRESNWVLGGASLFSYALGQSILLLAVGLFTGLIKQMARFRQVGSVITRLSALVFMLGGALLIAQAAGWLDVFAFF